MALPLVLWYRSAFYVSSRGVQRQSTEESQILHALEQPLRVHPQLAYEGEKFQ